MIDKEHVRWLYNNEYDDYIFNIRTQLESEHPNDLLVINICDRKDGWNKLCDFLNLNIPNIPFPHENRRLT